MASLSGRYKTHMLKNSLKEKYHVRGWTKVIQSNFVIRSQHAVGLMCCILNVHGEVWGKRGKPRNGLKYREQTDGSQRGGGQADGLNR